VVSGGSICLFPDSPIASSHWDVFNFAGEAVISLDFGGVEPCWNTAGIGAGIYAVRLKLDYLDGRRATVWQKIIVTR
jgi:hypothetical protein